MNVENTLFQVFNTRRTRPWIFMVLPVALLIFMPGPAAHGQTTWAVEGSKPSFGEFNFPDPACVPILPPYLVLAPPVPPGNCPPLNQFPPADCKVGGSAVDNDGNVFSGGPKVPAMLHADTRSVMMTDTAGNFLTTMPIGGTNLLPGTITGLGYDSRNDVVWVTDGQFFVGTGLSFCVLPPQLFPLQAIPKTPGTIASGLAWDPCTKTLWSCDCAGIVWNFTTAGVVISSFPASPPLSIQLTGITVNTTNGNVQVTDAFQLAEFRPTGVLALTGPFYLQANPYPVPLWAGGLNGLGFSLRPQNYGKGCTPTGGLPPSIGYAGGYPYEGNNIFTVFENGVTPGSDVYLFFGFQPACPGLPISGCPGGMVWLFPFGAPLFLGTAGGASFSLNLQIPQAANPCGPPVGLPIFLQFANVLSYAPLKLELSDALSFTIGEI